MRARRRRRLSTELSLTMSNHGSVTSLDTSALPATNRSAHIIAAFDLLPIGDVLELDDEQDPRALRNEFLHRRPGKFSWDGRNLGTGRWIVRIERIDEQADLATFLRHCSPFQPANEATFADLAAVGLEQGYRQGETIFDEGEPWPFLGIVRSGRVVYTLLSPDGKVHALGERLVHDSLNESGVFDGGGATTRAEALTPTELILLPASSVIHACRNDSELALGFLAAASQARRRSIDTIADLAFAHVLQRIAKFLLSYAPTTTGMAAGLPGLDSLSQAQIAASAGTVRDMAARALVRLRAASAVHLERGRVRALDRTKLEEFAHNIQAPPV
jgi:CRP/FNR family cyclic AMP-dependent transcriptional regulator